MWLSDDVTFYEFEKSYAYFNIICFISLTGDGECTDVVRVGRGHSVQTGTWEKGNYQNYVVGQVTGQYVGLIKGQYIRRV